MLEFFEGEVLVISFRGEAFSHWKVPDCSSELRFDDA